MAHGFAKERLRHPLLPFRGGQQDNGSPKPHGHDDLAVLASTPRDGAWGHWREASRHVSVSIVLHLPAPLRSALVTRLNATMRALTSSRLGRAHGRISMLN